LSCFIHALRYLLLLFGTDMYSKMPSSAFVGLSPPMAPPQWNIGGAYDILTQKFPTYGIARKDVPDQKPIPLPQLVSLLLVPTLTFTATFWLTSFSLRYSAATFANVACYCMVLPSVAFLGMALGASGRERSLLLITSACCLVAWVSGYAWGDYNYQSLMRPYYDITQLNTYPSINPQNVTGAQVMDAGMIEFIGGSRSLPEYSLGFKNGDTYCVAPIGKVNASGNATGNASGSTFDFWAVGMNCCAGHGVEFKCGEYNAMSTWGLRVMEDSHRNMYEVAVKQAEASFNIRAPHPVLVYMMTDPKQEVQEYSDDGIKNFTFAIFAYFAFQIAVVVGAAAVLPWM